MSPQVLNHEYFLQGPSRTPYRHPQEHVRLPLAPLHLHAHLQGGRPGANVIKLPSLCKRKLECFPLAIPGKITQNLFNSFCIIEKSFIKLTIDLNVDLGIF
jgi:hypothetical protein